jgi:hypothetical protein
MKKVENTYFSSKSSLSLWFLWWCKTSVQSPTFLPVMRKSVASLHRTWTNRPEVIPTTSTTMGQSFHWMSKCGLFRHTDPKLTPIFIRQETGMSLLARHSSIICTRLISSPPRTIAFHHISSVCSLNLSFIEHQKVDCIVIYAFPNWYVGMHKQP